MSLPALVAAAVLSATSFSAAALSEEWRSKPTAEDHVELLTSTRHTKDKEVFESLDKRLGVAIAAEDVKALESISSSILKGKKYSPSGRSMIACYHEVIGRKFAEPKADDTASWDKLKALTTKWEQTFPESPTAVLATTQLFLKFAWAGRGGGYSNTVTDKGAAIFRAANETVLSRLQQTKAVSANDPDWYRQVAATYKNLSVDNSKMLELMDEAVKKYPEDFAIFTNASFSFLAKWNGSDAEFASFVDHVRTTANGPVGDVLYARIYSSIACCELDYFDGQIFTKGAANWDHLKSGLEQIRQRYPDPQNIDIEAYFACSALDVTVLPPLMAEIGSAPDPGTWRDVSFFRQCQKIASNMVSNPNGPRAAWWPQK